MAPISNEWLPSLPDPRLASSAAWSFVPLILHGLQVAKYLAERAAIVWPQPCATTHLPHFRSGSAKALLMDVHHFRHAGSKVAPSKVARLRVRSVVAIVAIGRIPSSSFRLFLLLFNAAILRMCHCNFQHDDKRRKEIEE